MQRYRAAYPPEFRRQMVELVRSGRTPEELSREFEPTPQSISTWVKQAERDAGKRADGPTSAERDELSRLRRENHRSAPGARHTGKGGGLVRAGEQGEPERVYRFMSVHQAEFPIRTMARVLKVSASGYYAWLSRPASARATADADLARRIRTIHAGSRATYGAPRVHAELAAEGVHVGRKRVARLMHGAGIAGVSRRRRPPVTTRRDPDHRPAHDLVRRNFTAEGPNELWVADITFLPTMTGFLYLAVVLDAWSRRIVGWAFSADLKTQSCSMRLIWRWRRESRTASSIIRIAARNTRPSPLAIAAKKRACGRQPGRSATPMTMRCARASSQRSNASFSTGIASKRIPRPAWRSSTSLRAFTIPPAVTPRSAISRPSNTKGSATA